MDTVPIKALSSISPEIIEHKIFLIRGYRVIFDVDLAKLYGVSTKVLNQAVKRNLERFPEDFMFQPSRDELENLRSQTVTSSWGGLRYIPYVFTEQGIAMLSSVLRSKRAVRVNILIMRVFVRMREMMASHQELARRVEELERKYSEHDVTIKDTFEEIKKLLTPPKEKINKRPMGFSAGR